MNEIYECELIKYVLKNNIEGGLLNVVFMKEIKSVFG
jgi:hypothetical protein